MCSLRPRRACVWYMNMSVCVCASHTYYVSASIFNFLYNVSLRRGNSYLVKHFTREMRNEWQLLAYYEVPWFNLWYFMMELKYFRVKGDSKRTQYIWFWFAIGAASETSDRHADMFIFIRFFFPTYHLLYLPNTEINKQTTRTRCTMVQAARYLIFIYYLLVCK